MLYKFDVTFFFIFCTDVAKYKYKYNVFSFFYSLEVERIMLVYDCDIIKIKRREIDECKWNYIIYLFSIYV